MGYSEEPGHVLTKRWLRSLASLDRDDPQPTIHLFRQSFHSVWQANTSSTLLVQIAWRYPSASRKIVLLLRIMKKFFKLIFAVGFSALIVLAIVFIFKTLSFTSKQLAAVKPIEKIELDDKCTQRFISSIQIPTLSYADRIDTLAFENLDSLFRKNYPLLYARTHLQPINEFSNIYKWKGRDPNLLPVLLIGHTDVVPIENEDAWEQGPFSGAIKDGYIWGRGTLDDKINVVGLMEAATMLLQDEYMPMRDIYFAFGHDEEVGGKAGAKAMAAYFAENNIQFEFVLDEGLVVLKEALDGLDPPLAMIGVAEKGFANMQLSVELAAGGHSSMPPSNTAIGMLANAVARLSNEPFPARIDGATRGLLEYAGPEMTLFNKTLFANLWATKGLIKNSLAKDATAAALIRTTTAPTIFNGGIKDNVLPSQARAMVNFRILPGETVASVKKHVEELIDNPAVKIAIDENFSSNPTTVSSTTSFGFRVLQKTLQETHPETIIAPGLVIAATDARSYSDVANDVYRFTPVCIDRDDIKRIHGNNERISVENYHDAIRFYKRLMENVGK